MKSYKLLALFSALAVAISFLAPTSAAALSSEEVRACLRGKRTATSAYKKAARNCDNLSKKANRLHTKIFKDIATWEAAAKSLQDRIAAEKDSSRKARLQRQYDQKGARQDAKNKKDMATWDALTPVRETACGPTLQSAQEKVESYGSCS